MKTMTKLMVAVMTMAAMTGFAQDTKPAKQPEPKEFVFKDGDLIDGKLDGPDGVFVQSPPPIKHQSIIKIRENFDRKVMDSVSEL